MTNRPVFFIFSLEYLSPDPVLLDMLKFLKKAWSYPEIQIALAFGIGIILQAYFYKRIYHLEIKGIFILLPGLIATAYEAMIHKKENKEKKYLKPIYWVAAILLASIISILIPLFR